METRLLDLPISYFPFDTQRNTFANVPSQQTTLRRIVSTRYYQADVDAVCRETDSHKQYELKKQLPSFTPVAQLRHRKKDTSFEERIINQWPMGMGDIDTKDNPGVDMAALKQVICSLPFVLLCAYSVRRGLWFVVRLPDNQTPDTLAAHFRHLQRLFSEKYGIILDSTKGGNPTALRFVSFDDEPFFNDEATVMEGTYTPPLPKAQPYVFDQSLDIDSEKLLKRIVRLVQIAGEGQRHTVLLKSAKLAGGYVATGALDEQTAVLALETLASEWPMFTKSQKTIRDGIRFGLSSPIKIEVQEKRQWKVEPRKPKAPTATRKNEVLQEAYIDHDWQPFDYSVEAQPVQSDPVQQNEKPSIIVSKSFQLPRAIEYMWSQFSRPPIWYNKIAAHKAILRIWKPEQPQQVVSSIAEQLANPGSIIQPIEAQLERMIEEPCNSYPVNWDEPNAPDAVPQIKEINVSDNKDFFEWQRHHPYFSQMGLASLNIKTKVEYRSNLYD